MSQHLALIRNQRPSYVFGIFSCAVQLFRAYDRYTMWCLPMQGCGEQIHCSQSPQCFSYSSLPFSPLSFWKKWIHLILPFLTQVLILQTAFTFQLRTVSLPCYFPSICATEPTEDFFFLFKSTIFYHWRVIMRQPKYRTIIARLKCRCSETTQAHSLVQWHSLAYYSLKHKIQNCSS